MLTPILNSTLLNLMLLVMVSYVLSRGGLHSEVDLDKPKKFIAWIIVWIVLIETGYNCTIVVISVIQYYDVTQINPDWLHHPAFPLIFISKHFLLFYLKKRR